MVVKIRCFSEPENDQVIVLESRLTRNNGRKPGNAFILSLAVGRVVYDHLQILAPFASSTSGSRWSCGVGRLRSLHLQQGIEMALLGVEYTELRGQFPTTGLQ
jgi:hypothetical protein